MSEAIEETKGTLVVDFDGTLRNITSAGQSYAALAPRRTIIEKLREYLANGYRILLFTSRNKGFYVDDPAIRPDEFLKLSEEEIQNLLGQE